EVQETLRRLQATQPETFAACFDARILDIPLYRLAPRELPPAGITPLAKDREKAKGEAKNLAVIRGAPACVVGATPGGIYGMLSGGKLLGTPIAHCLIL